MIRPLTLLLLFPVLAQATTDESFENAKPGPLSRYASAIGTWTANEGHAEIIKGKGHTGQHALRIFGGNGQREVMLELPAIAKQGTGLIFHAERWTARAPFEFRVESEVNGQWTEIWNGDRAVRVGGYHARADIDIPANSRRIRIRSKAADGGGVLLDDFRLEAPGPATVHSVTAFHPVAPAFVRETFNPVTGIRIDVRGRNGSLSLDAVEVLLDGTTHRNDITEIHLIRGDEDPAKRSKDVVASAKVDGNRVLIQPDQLNLKSGSHAFWISPVIRDGADLDGVVKLSVPRIAASNQPHEVAGASDAIAQRIGYAVRLPGDGGSVSYRIPGLAETRKGTLIGVYDIRWKHSGDLPADIDVGISRSTDGGRTWGPMIKAMRKEIDGIGRGIGDAAILVDPKNNRIWIAVLAAPKSGHPIWSSSPRTSSPDQVGQFLLTYSDDDGLTWSAPINITEPIKRLDDEDTQNWGLLFQGPGSGFAMRDGTLVFPSQVWTVKANGKVGESLGVLVYSKDHGKTWQSSKASTFNAIHASESQALERADGSILFNARNEHRSGYRMVAITPDLGKTWQPHPTDRNPQTGLIEPTCQASILRVSFDPNIIAFSNPASKGGRHSMTLKLSTDEGMTWPESHHALYDSRNGYGYSSLATVGKDHIGVLYEGRDTMYFLRFRLDDLMQK